MKIAVATEDGQVCGHFGHCEEFRLYEGDGLTEQELPNPGHRPGYLPGFLKEHGVDVIISGGMGQGAVDLFDRYGIEVVTGAAGPSRAAAEAWTRGELKSSGSVCHEHAHAADGTCG